MTRVSIVIPTYDRAELLPEAIASVLTQDHPDVECVVVDDGSSDGTPQLLEAYGSTITACRQDHQGQAAAVNRGFAIAHGELVGVLASDDTLDPGSIASGVRAFAETPDAVAVHGRVRIVDTEGQPLSEYAVGDMQLADMLRSVIGPASTGILYRRDHVLRLGGWDRAYRYGVDFEILLRIGLEGPFVYVDRSLGTWRHHPGSISVAREDPGRLAREYVDIVRGFLDRPDLPASIDATVRARAMRAAYYIAGIVVGGDTNQAGERFLLTDRVGAILEGRDPDSIAATPGRPPVAVATSPTSQNAVPLSLVEGWQDYGPPYTGASYARDGAGIVHLEGLVRRTHGDEPIIATLPEGYRPSGLQLYAQVAGGDVAARVDIDASGAIRLVSGSAAYVSLSGISFLGGGVRTHG